MFDIHSTWHILLASKHHNIVELRARHRCFAVISHLSAQCHEYNFNTYLQTSYVSTQTLFHKTGRFLSTALEYLTLRIILSTKNPGKAATSLADTLCEERQMNDIILIILKTFGNTVTVVLICWYN